MHKSFLMHVFWVIFKAFKDSLCGMLYMSINEYNLFKQLSANVWAGVGGVI